MFKLLIYSIIEDFCAQFHNSIHIFNHYLNIMTILGY
jgi:hypothetical protein